MLKRYYIAYDAFRGEKTFHFNVGIVAESREDALRVIEEDAERLGFTYKINSVENIDQD